MLASAETTALALRAFGLHLFAQGLPSYVYVCVITAVQDTCPQCRNFLTATWQIDKKWQRAVQAPADLFFPWRLSELPFRWPCFWVGTSGLKWFSGHAAPSRIGWARRDLVFPADNLDHTTNSFVHLSSPTTSHFARRQRGRIDDALAIQFLFSVVQCLLACALTTRCTRLLCTPFGDSGTPF